MTSFDVAELISAFSSISLLCRDMCRRFPKDQMIILKSQAVAEKYVADLQNPDTQGIVKKALKEFTQILLDVSFLEENQLVEDEFPISDGRARMTKLMELYARPVDLVKKVFGDFSLPMDILGKDYVECLHWRKGALMYMYCNTLYEQTERVRDELTQFMQCLEEGVRHLESMLAVRLPTNKVQIECQVLTEDTLSLIKQGLFSDTHVLALMYAGEMCYWHHTLLKQKKQKEAATLSVMTGGLNHASQEDISSITKSASSLDIAGDDVWQARHPGNRHSIHVCEGMLLFDSKAVGKRMLQRYVEVVKGPLRFVGWDCARAEELLRLLDAQG
ncbi:UPF0600 protein C5orf51 homolog [Lytechinus variegatus]|uniref:UPF0600 protein C5orf51 homolog n=1 Tax=Lytechinus variegatus TaxID=7654 RepID=UPI001BB16D72|nr:UPF0600 protein C5orf51 homolog [Lytechinus variegatus]